MGLQSTQCEDVALRRTGESTLEVMVLASPMYEVQCAIESKSPDEVVVPQSRFVTFAANSPARSKESTVIAGVKDLLLEDSIRFTLAVRCQSADARFDTAAASVQAFATDVQFPTIESVRPALSSFVGQQVTISGRCAHQFVCTS